jgi:hypothetical protein
MAHIFMFGCLSILWPDIVTERVESPRMSLPAVTGECILISFLRVGKVVHRTHMFLNVHGKLVLSFQMGGIILQMLDFHSVMHFWSLIEESVTI